MSSGWEGTESTTNRRATRTASARALGTAGMCSKTSSKVTTSNARAGKSSFVPSIWCAVRASIPPNRTAWMSRERIGSSSIAVTVSLGNSSSRGQRKAPRPLPTSSRSSGVSDRSTPKTRRTLARPIVRLNLCISRSAACPIWKISTKACSDRSFSGSLRRASGRSMGCPWAQRPRTNAAASFRKYRSPSKFIRSSPCRPLPSGLPAILPNVAIDEVLGLEISVRLPCLTVAPDRDNEPFEPFRDPLRKGVAHGHETTHEH